MNPFTVEVQNGVVMIGVNYHTDEIVVPVPLLPEGARELAQQLLEVAGPASDAEPSVIDGLRDVILKLGREVQLLNVAREHIESDHIVLGKEVAEMRERITTLEAEVKRLRYSRRKQKAVRS